MAFFDDVEAGLNDAQKFLNQNNPLTQSSGEGFRLPPAYSSDGNGLPYSKVPDNRDGKLKRNIISWFVPQIGIIRMYINPKSIQYSYKKEIERTRTKGGYTLQYWGEDLPSLTIQGTTGSSGVEGINALYELYRAEQYAFDSTALLIASNNSANSGVQELLGSGINSLGQLAAGLFGGGDNTQALTGGLLGGFLGANSFSSLSSNNIGTLAEMACTVEMYYDGWVFRGYFEDMTVSESADDFLLNYTIKFRVTQKRGYRGNYMPWHKSPKHGPSNYDTPNSFNNIIKK